MIAVIHLVWGPLGPAPLREFLRTYHAHEAGAPHELVILLNGVPADGEDAVAREALMVELRQTPHRLIELERPVLDLVAYEQAAAMVEHEYMCMLNSHSRLLCAGWLAAFEQALRRPKIGLVGATGSWASMRSYALRTLGLPSAYREVWPDRRRTFAEFQRLELERTGAPPPRGALARLHTARALSDMAIGFPRFPAPHIRTNAFMAQRTLLRAALSESLRRKVNAHRLESGHRSITVQIEQTGLRALVVDREGRAFESLEWPESETFWQGDQRGLLVADNQTETYQSADATRRRLLAQYAWGQRAAPTEPTA
jgi:hypothetical protein